jgi:hypothetical protein
MTPRKLGLRMPGEWERHDATWLAWPHNVEDWPGRFEPIPWVYGEIVRKLHQLHRVGLGAGNFALHDPATTRRGLIQPRPQKSTYLTITPQAIRAPAFPAGSLFISSAAA